MQISRTFLVACGAAYCLALLPLCAADADTDLKLREALEKKLNELQNPSPTATPKPVVAAPQPKAAPAPAPATPAPVPLAAPAAKPAIAPVMVAPQPVDSDAIAKAREALRQKMTELDAQSEHAVPQPVVAAPAPQKATEPAARPVPPAQPVPPAAQPAAVVVTPAPVTQAAEKPVLAVPAPADSDAIAKVREALRQKMTELDAQTATAAAGQPMTPTPAGQSMPRVAAPASAGVAIARPSAAQPPSTKPKAIKGQQAFPPLQGPPPALAADKEQRLQALLSKYRADQITPEEYHLQRAKILAEP